MERTLWGGYAPYFYQVSVTMRGQHSAPASSPHWRGQSVTYYPSFITRGSTGCTICCTKAHCCCFLLVRGHHVMGYALFLTEGSEAVPQLRNAGVERSGVRARKCKMQMLFARRMHRALSLLCPHTSSGSNRHLGRPRICCPRRALHAIPTKMVGTEESPSVFYMAGDTLR